MKNEKIILGLLFVFLTTASQAQKKTYIPPHITQKTYTFWLPELQIDSSFIAKLDTVLFDKNNSYMYMVISSPNDESSRNFIIDFAKKDSLNYCMEVSLWDIPARKTAGFFEHNGFFYWFGNDAPPGIILGSSKSKRRFSYTDRGPVTYDPPFWYFNYNKQTGNIEIKERYCH